MDREWTQQLLFETTVLRQNQSAGGTKATSMSIQPPFLEVEFSYCVLSSQL
jgi:hypothetical protein